MSRAGIDMAGERYGLLVALEKVGSRYGSALWVFKCDCGTVVDRTRCSVMGTEKKGLVNSCGCYYGRKVMEMHGLRKDPLYSVWEGIKKRCNNKKSKSYKDYGARGISVCDEWSNSFHQFKVDMGDRPEGFELERIDNEKGYSKSNCKWADRREQAVNKRDTIFVKVKGNKYPLTEALRKFNPEIGYHTVYRRLRFYGWSDEEAIFS